MPSISQLRKAALAAAAGLGAYGAAEQDADAVMLPDVRKLMNAMKAQGGKTLFHDSWNLRGLLEGGVQDPKLVSSAKEGHKPLGLYATDQLKKIPGHASFVYKDTDTTKALKERLLEHWGIKDYSNIEGSTDSRIARIVMKPDAVTREIPEEFMHSYNKMLAQVRKQMAKMEGDQELYQNPLAKKDLTQHWQDLTDVLKIKQVDMQPDVAEHIITNPEKIGGIFWENAVWTPEQGYQTFGESRRRVFGMPSRKGQSRLDVGLPSKEGPRTLSAKEAVPENVLTSDSDLESLTEKMLAKPLEPVTKLLPKVDYTTSQLIEKPGASFYNAEPGSIEFIKQFKKDLNTLGTLKDSPDIKSGFAYPNVKNAAKQLKDMYWQPAPKQSKKGSGYIPGAIAGAMGLGALAAPDEAEAGWISKLAEVAKTMPGKMNADDMLKFFKGRGVTDAEVRRILPDVPSKTSKQWVQEQIDKNVLRLKDEVYGGDPPTIETLDERNPYRAAQFSSYQLPGGENYREMFVTAPSKTSGSWPLGWTVKQEANGKWSAYAPNGEQEYFGHMTEESIKKRVMEKVKNKDDWQDGHGAYSDIQNPIVRIRFNERIIPGALANRTYAEQTAYRQQVQDEIAHAELGASWAGLTLEAKKSLLPEIDSAMQSFNRENSKRVLFIEEMQGPSDREQSKMPEVLRKRIYDIGVKRILSYAKENGFDAVAWTPGEVQADRYDLSKQIESLHYDPKEGALFYTPISGRQELTGHHLKPEDLERYVGKEAARRLLESPITPTKLEWRGQTDQLDNVHSLSGLDLQIGGEGLKNLYDQMLPKMFEKYGKEKVERIKGDWLPKVQKADYVYYDALENWRLYENPAPRGRWYNQMWNRLSSLDDGGRSTDRADRLLSRYYDRYAAVDREEFEASRPEFRSISPDRPLKDNKTTVPYIPITSKTPKDYNMYGIGGMLAGGGVAGAVLGMPDQAEAFPLGKLKAAAKAIPNTLRSEDAFYKLLGHKLNLSMQGGPRQPYEVVDILRNPDNDWRYVIVKDARGKRYQLPMTKDYLNVYLGAKGTQDHLEIFRDEGYRGKQYKALKSLTIRETKRENTSHVSATDFRAWNKMQMEKAREIDPALVNDYVYVKILGGKKELSKYMPREYANFLAQKGFVKILKH